MFQPSPSLPHIGLTRGLIEAVVVGALAMAVVVAEDVLCPPYGATGNLLFKAVLPEVVDSHPESQVVVLPSMVAMVEVKAGLP